MSDGHASPGVHDGLIFECSTNGGAAGKGWIFTYDPRQEAFTRVYAFTGSSAVDNTAWSLRGRPIPNEDGSATPQALRGPTLDGSIFPFCYNNVNFSRAGMGSCTRASGRVFASDWRGSEFCGATFRNEWRFVNIQSPGITVAITGPWGNGAL